MKISKFITPTEIIFLLYSGQGEMKHRRIKRSMWRVWHNPDGNKRSPQNPWVVKSFATLKIYSRLKIKKIYLLSSLSLLNTYLDKKIKLDKRRFQRKIFANQQKTARVLVYPCAHCCSDFRFAKCLGRCSDPIIRIVKEIIIKERERILKYVHF